MRPQIILTYNDGDPVPDWMIGIVPSDADSVPPDMTFIGSGCVVEMGDDYYVLGSTNQPPLRVSNGKNCTLYAVGKSVILPIRFQLILGENRRGEGWTGRITEDGVERLD